MTLIILRSRVRRFSVTWRHRWRYQSTRHGHRLWDTNP